MPERKALKHVLQTERLTLRCLEAGDAPFMLALLNDPAWIRFIGDRGVRTVEAARAYLEERMISMYARLGFARERDMTWAGEKEVVSVYAFGP